MNFELLEKQAAAGAKVLLLCTPHNPGGRVWTRGELERVAEICTNCLSSRTKFITISSSPGISTCLPAIAPSKTFNIAGLQAAAVVIPNEDIRRQYNATLKTLSIHMESYFGLTATEASYTHGDEWLNQLLVYLEGNRDALLAYVNEHLPKVKSMSPEGTYMVWLDCTAISDKLGELKQLMFDKAGVAFTEGSVFGEQGAGYLLVNLACTRTLLLKALDKFAGAIQEENATHS